MLSLRCFGYLSRDIDNLELVNLVVRFDLGYQYMVINMVLVLKCRDRQKSILIILVIIVYKKYIKKQFDKVIKIEI